MYSARECVTATERWWPPVQPMAATSTVLPSSLFGGSQSAGEMQVSLVSFGFKHGLPLEADLVFDVRFMPNPFYIDSMRQKTGLDPEVREYVFSFRETEQFIRWGRSIMLLYS